MNLEKQQKKIVLLMEKAEQATSRKESKEILKKFKKVRKKIAKNSEISRAWPSSRGRRP